MKCPICDAWSEVLDTREARHLTMKRRRECANGHRFPTLEVLPGFVNTESARRSLVAVKRARARWTRDETIRRDPRTSTLAIARDFGMSPDAIRDIRAGRRSYWRKLPRGARKDLNAE